MKSAFYSFMFTALLALPACQSDSGNRSEVDDNDEITTEETPVKLIEYLVGEWQMQSGAAEDDASAGAPGERLVFTSEARYIAYEGNQPVDSGAYRMNEQLGHIYLESEADEQPREFDIDVDEAQMSLTPKAADENVAGGKYVYRRIGEASLEPDKSEKGLR